jgi:DNA uptake protein ComE-like DNA-binding protein
MNARHFNSIVRGVRRNASRRNASVLVIVLWIAFGLVSIALYFGQSMIFHLQATDNDEASVEADQAIEGAGRYISGVLSNLLQQGLLPCALVPGGILCYTPQSDSTITTLTYLDEEVAVGDAKFWIIGRDSGGLSNVNNSVPVFGLVDEASKLNLNTATATNLEALPYMTPQLAESIVNWRSSSASADSGGAELEYGMLNPPYSCKNAPFETVDELNLVMGSTTDILYGADLNLNGILDLNENNQSSYQAAETTVNLDNGLNAGILEYVTVWTTTNANVVNVNTAPAPVLACLPGIGTDNAQSLVAYRQQHPDQLATNWVVQALGQEAASALLPYITNTIYQVSADVAAVGHYGRGYRRTLFVFDISSGVPQIVYRRDLTRMGWALGNALQTPQTTGTM